MTWVDLFAPTWFAACGLSFIWSYRRHRQRMERLRQEHQAFANRMIMQAAMADPFLLDPSNMILTDELKARAERERQLLNALLPQSEIDRLAKFHTIYLKGKEGRLWHIHWHEQAERMVGPDYYYYYNMRTEVLFPEEGTKEGLCVTPHFIFYRTTRTYPTASEALITMILWITGDEATAWKMAVKHGKKKVEIKDYQMALYQGKPEP